MARLGRRPRRARGIAVIVAIAGALLGGAAAPSLGLNLPQDVVVNPNPVDWTPNVLDGQVKAFARVGRDIVVGGTFTQVRNANTSKTLTRNNIFAYDATTGKIDPNFVPAVNGQVSSLAAAPDGASVFAGGYFSQVNGVATKGLTKLNVSTGQTVPVFSAKTNSNVRAIAVRGNRLFVAGAFTSIRSVARSHVAAVDVNTGAVDPNLDLQIAGTHHGDGTTTVAAMDVTADASRMVVIGNFASAGGAARVQLAVVDLTTAPATVADWKTDAYTGLCSTSFPTYMHDVDFAPDGSYFVVVTTGAGRFPTTLCDTAARWETNVTGSDLQPTWVDYTGGDTLWSVAITGAAVYVGGHQRWENNANVPDRAASGAVSRPGIAALDPLNGMPYRWNPTKTRGVGTFTLVSTPAGLLVGSDTTSLGGEYHARLGMFPTAGGQAPPVGTPASLPGTLYLAPRDGCPQPDASVLYRIDAGGPVIASLDCGPDWQADVSGSSQYRNTGSAAASFGPVGAVDGSVPPTTPAAVFGAERYDPGSPPEMSWHFPVPPGTHVRVRLYFANQYPGTSEPGQRVFNVALDGAVVLPNFDIVADVGNEVGEMKAFDVTSDGSVDIDFGHVVENPLVDAIELVNLDVPPGPPPPAEQLVAQPFDGTSAGSPAVDTTPGVDWTKARGTFALNGTVYAGWADGNVYAFPFDGSTLGAGSDIIAAGGYVNGRWISFANATGMFWWGGRLYYARAGDPHLYYRYFSPESQLIGSMEYTVSGGSDGLDWSSAHGMTAADGHIFFATTDGNLHRIGFTGGGVPVPGTDEVIGGPGVDGRDWRSNGLFLVDPGEGDTTPPTVPGTPSATSSTVGAVDLSWAAATDPDDATLTYDVYRDGGPTPIATFASASVTTVAFTDTGLVPGSVHTYAVDATDGTNVSAQSAPSDPVTVHAYLFTENFGGGFGAWTKVTNLTLDGSSGASAPPSALGLVSGAASYAYHDLPATQASVCTRVALNVSSVGSPNVTVLRFRTAAGASIGRAYLTSARALYLRADVQGTAIATGVTFPSGWTRLEVCLSTGASGSWSVYLNGSQIGSWTTDNGSTDVGRLQIGDTAPVTAAIGYDDVVVDTNHIG